MATGPSVSASSPYCTAEQFLIIFDYRTVAQLCSDNNVAALRTELLDPTSKPGGILDYALRSASGDLETACLRGGIYSVDDLQNATGQATNPDASANANTNAAWYIRRLVAAYAKWLLYAHRPELFSAIPAEVQQAAQSLQMLATGERILPLQPNIDAGHLTVETETAPIVENRNMLTFQIERYLGRRANRRDRGF